MIQINFTEKEIDFMKEVLNVPDPSFLIERICRQWFEQLVNQQIQTKTIDEKIDIIKNKFKK